MELTFREAVRSDLRELVLMLADDRLGATREDTSEPVLERCALGAEENLYKTHRR